MSASVFEIMGSAGRGRLRGLGDATTPGLLPAGTTVRLKYGRNSTVDFINRSGRPSGSLPRGGLFILENPAVINALDHSFIGPARAKSIGAVYVNTVDGGIETFNEETVEVAGPVEDDTYAIAYPGATPAPPPAPPPASPGWTTGEEVALGVGIAVVFGGIVYAVSR